MPIGQIGHLTELQGEKSEEYRETSIITIVNTTVVIVTITPILFFTLLWIHYWLEEHQLDMKVCEFVGTVLHHLT